MNGIKCDKPDLDEKNWRNTWNLPINGELAETTEQADETLVASVNGNEEKNRIQ